MQQYPTISFQNISFGFEEEQIVTDFSFKAKAGQHTILKGESGSGKSTLLKLMLGFFNPDSGKISVNNEKWHPKILRKQTAWLPQDLNLGSGSVKQVMDAPFSFAANQDAPTNPEKYVNMLNKLGLKKDVLNKAFRDLSTGQRQRVGLALCHLLDKPLLLLDEPTSALDKASKQKAADLLLTQKCTIISTSHDPFWVQKADNIVEL